MSKKIVLVSCVAKKRSEPSPARSLYISDLFEKASSYAEKIGDEWFILSALYGLVPPEKIIAPYDKTLLKMPNNERQKWASQVFGDLKNKISAGDTVIFLAGERYRENLIDPVTRLGCKIEIPMEGMRIGEQMQWLNRQNRGN